MPWGIRCHSITINSILIEFEHHVNYEQTQLAQTVEAHINEDCWQATNEKNIEKHKNERFEKFLWKYSTE
jgi:dethiobiotin synthetase